MGRLRRVTLEASLAIGGALLLAVMTFATRWYGVAHPPRDPFSAGSQSAAGAWSQLTVLRWFVLATVVLTLLATAGGRAGGIGMGLMVAAALVAVLTAIGLCDRILIDPPSPAVVDDIKLGAYLALLGAVAAAIGTTAALTAPGRPA